MEKKKRKAVPSFVSLLWVELGKKLRGGIVLLWSFCRLVDVWYLGGPTCPPNLLDYWLDVEYRGDGNGLRGMSATGGPP